MPTFSSNPLLTRLPPLLLALLLAAGCGSPTPPPGTEPPPQPYAEGEQLPPAVPAFAGSKQPDAAHSTLRLSRTRGLRADGVDATSAELTLRNRANEPLPGLAVTVSVGYVSEPGAQDGPSRFSAVTDASGTVRGTLASTVAGSFKVHALVVGLGAPYASMHYESLTAVEFLPGPPVELKLVNPVGTQVAGKPFLPQLLVEAVDAFGNPSPPAGEISLSLGSAPPGATLSGTVQLGAPSGQALFSDSFLTLAGEGYTLRADAPGLRGVQSEPFGVQPAEPVRLAFLDQPTDVVAGEPLPTLRVAHYDAYGNLAASAMNWAEVRLSAAPHGASLLGATSLYVRGGMAAFEGLRIERAGDGYRLEAINSPSTPALSRPFRVSPAAPSATGSTLVATPERVLADGAAPSTLRLRVRDAFGNEIPDAAVQFEVEQGQGELAAPSARSGPWGSASVRLTSEQPGRVTVRAQVGAAIVREHVRFSRACSVQVGLPGLPSAPGSGTSLVADFDADGNPDIAAATLDGVQVALGLGDGTFGRPQPFAGYGLPNALAAGDLDGNGTQDLVLVSSRLSVLLGRGDGTFALPQTSFAADGSFSSMNWVGLTDVSGDGLLDVLYTEDSNRGLGVRINHGGGVLAAHALWPAPDGVPLLSDLDRDGHGDLVFRDYYGSALKVLRGRAGGGFEPVVSLPVGARPRGGLVAGDVDGDGDGDLLALRELESPVLLRQQYDGSFQLEASPLVTSGYFEPKQLTLGDVDGDGDLDVAAGDDFQMRVRLLLNDGTGRFEERGQYPHGVSDRSVLRLVDLTHDGRPELLMDSGAVLLNQGDGTLLSPRVQPSSYSTTRVLVDDWNGDGRADLATVGSSTGVLLGTGGGALADYAAVSDLSTGAAVSGDFDGDGRSELVLARTYAQRLDFYQADGAGLFAAPSPLALQRLPTALHTADLDGDGRRDLVLANEGEGVVQVLHNGGATGFAPSAAYAVGAQPTAVTTGDLNGDGLQDLVVSRRAARRVTVLLALAQGGYGPPLDVAPEGQVGTVVVADLNGDGMKDLAVGISETRAAAVAILQGKGDGTFLPPSEILLPSAGRLEAGDMNGDGHLDLVSLGGGSLSLLYGDGDGTFAPPLAYGLGLGLSTGTLADLDGDGRLDVAGHRDVVTRSDSTVLFNRCLR